MAEQFDADAADAAARATRDRSDDRSLVRVLGEIQRRGAIGRSPIDESIAHARQYSRVLPPGPLSVVDLGSGGGLPALVVAFDRADLEFTLVERRMKRVDLLSMGVRALDLGGRVRVVGDDAVAAGRRFAGQFDIATARSFAAPSMTIELALPFLRPQGSILISEAPDSISADADRPGWDGRQVASSLISGSDLDRLHVRDGGRAEHLHWFHVEPVDQP